VSWRGGDDPLDPAAAAEDDGASAPPVEAVDPDALTLDCPACGERLVGVIAARIHLYALHALGLDGRRVGRLARCPECGTAMARGFAMVAHRQLAHDVWQAGTEADSGTRLGG
jgi:predicted RNA-binding Zn-ribbon protein involved in translation (DUF1610 family)